MLLHGLFILMRRPIFDAPVVSECRVLHMEVDSINPIPRAVPVAVFLSAVGHSGQGAWQRGGRKQWNRLSESTF